MSEDPSPILKPLICLGLLICLVLLICLGLLIRVIVRPVEVLVKILVKPEETRIDPAEEDALLESQTARMANLTTVLAMLFPTEFTLLTFLPTRKIHRLSKI